MTMVTAQAAGHVAAPYEIGRGRGVEEAALPSAAHPGRLSLGAVGDVSGFPTGGLGPANCSTRIHKDQRAARTHLADPPAPASTGDPPSSVTPQLPTRKRRRHR
jgi:hypothetical protein